MKVIKGTIIVIIVALFSAVLVTTYQSIEKNVHASYASGFFEKVKKDVVLSAREIKSSEESATSEGMSVKSDERSDFIDRAQCLSNTEYRIGVECFSKLPIEVQNNLKKYGIGPDTLVSTNSPEIYGLSHLLLKFFFIVFAIGVSAIWTIKRSARKSKI